MNSSFNIVKIPFQTKIKALRKIKGIAYYFFNDDWTKCYYQMPYLISGQYRPNDEAMMRGKTGKGTECWQDLAQYRQKLFPINQKNFQIANLNVDQKTKINQHIWEGNISTILNLDKWLSGSNPSGAEKKFSFTPFLTKFPQDHFLNFLVFTNLFNNVRSKQPDFLKKIHNNFTTFTDFDQQAISFQIFLEKKCNLPFLKLFYQYNRGLLSDETLSSELKSKLSLTKANEIYLQEILCQKTPELKTELKSSLARRDHFLSTIENKSLISKKEAKSIKSKLRTFFSDGFKLQKEILKFNDVSFVEGDLASLSALEIAHIFPVSKAWLKKDYKAIADYNNGIWISANLHTSFDKGRCHLKIKNKQQIYFYSLNKNKKMFIKPKWIVENKFAILKYIQKYLNILK